MKVLISNDDGVSAKGLECLATTLSTIADIVVMAPDRNRSGASHSLSLTRPLRVKQLENSYYSVEGTPTDCVHLALTGFLDETVDIVISGINDGANLGDDILYSGTVAAAIEGRFLGLPAIAISMVGENIQHYDTAAHIASHILVKLFNNKLSSKTILNINVPDLPIEKIKGIMVTRLGSRHCAEPVVKTADPRGKPIYWIGPPGIEADSGPGTDFYAVNQGFVSITPLNIDMTHYKICDELNSWLNQEVNIF